MKSVSIPGLERGLKLLEFLAIRGEAASFTEINQVLPDANRATLSRLLKVLISLNYLEKSESTGLYSLGEKMSIYSSAGKKGLREELIRKYGQIMREVSSEYAITTILFERTGNHLTSIHKELALDSIKMQPIGNAMDLNNEMPICPWFTLLVAFAPELDEITEVNYNREMIAFAREHGYASDNQLYKKLIIRLNFPIFNKDKRMVASLGVGARIKQLPEDKIEEFATIMKKRMSSIEPIQTA